MDEEFDHRELSNAPVADVPWFFRLGRFLSRHNIRGGERLIAQARRLGLLDQLAIYSLGDVDLRVPLWRPCNQWLEDDVRDYEAAFMRVLAGEVGALRGGVTLVDCGADIGTVSAHLVSRCRNISRVIAFEPNRAAFRVLRQNLDAMRVETEARHAAVGSFRGRGKLVSSSDDPSAHAMYIEPCESGPIRVERIDDLALQPNTPCVLKVDVEGTETSVIEGARETIRRASEVLVAFEAHPQVAKRVGQDPAEIMQALLAIRSDFTFEVDTTPALAVTPDRSLFDQLPPRRKRVHNVIARSSPSS